MGSHRERYEKRLLGGNDHPELNWTNHQACFSATGPSFGSMKATLDAESIFGRQMERAEL